MVKDVVIIGSGPAGLTAGIYTARARFNPVLIEGMEPGGQLTTTAKVENWPGMIEVMGPQLMMDMKKHAQAAGCQIISDTVSKVDFSKTPYKIFTKNGKELQAKSVIISTGAYHKKLHVPGEDEYLGKGVSFCATCDAPLFKDKEVLVVGGGNSGVFEADHLARVVKKVTLIHIADKLTATDPIKDNILNDPKVEFIYSSMVTKIEGDGQKVTQVVVENQQDKTTKTLKVDGVFIAIGMNPNSDIFKCQVDLDAHGYVVRKKFTQTSKDGIFVAGDVADYRYKQAITAAGEGCQAALDCQAYLALTDQANPAVAT